jgi:predicted DCC family thiol-disulfide oxidoreductase YuxK
MPHVILYDGVCGLCNRLNRFVRKRDRRDRFRFASIQSAYGRAQIVAKGGNPDDLDTLYVLTSDGRALVRSRAVLFILRELGGAWGLARLLVAWLPTSVLDANYRFVARRRYRVFGRFDACPAPAPGDREKFLDV